MEWALNFHLQHPPAKDRQVTPFGTQGTKGEKAEQRRTEINKRGEHHILHSAHSLSSSVNSMASIETNIKALGQAFSQTLMVTNSQMPSELR